ncbi:MAG: hypothetical protein AAFN13_04785 [Bacteroidota bacterium]
MLRLLGLCALLLLFTPSSIGQEAEIVSFRMADTADPNERVTITVTVRNTAENTLDDNGQIVEDRGWRRSDGYGVGMVFTDGPSSTGEVFNHVERLTRDVPAGGTTQVSWTVNVPRTPGEYLFTVTMVDDRNNAFGERIVENIEVEAAHVVGWRTRVQGRAQPEQEVTLSVTVENEGETNWPPGTYTVRGTLDRSPSRASRDEEAEFDFTIDLDEADWDYGVSDAGGHEFVVPRTSGNYVIELAVLHNGRPLDARNNPYTYTLRIAEPDIEGAIRRLEVEDDMRAGRDYRFRIHVRNTGDVTLREGDWRVVCDATPPRGVSDRNDPFAFVLDGDEDIEVRGTETIERSVEAPDGLGEWEVECFLEVRDASGRFDDSGRPSSVDIEVTSS